MRFFALLLGFACIANHANAETLTEQDRKELTAKLQQIQDSANAKIDSRFRAAISAYNQAMTSNEAAFDFYLKCVEKVQFKDQLKETSDFKNWRSNQKDEISDPNFKLALRYQLRWLVLTLKASSKNPDKAALTAEASEIIDAIFIQDITNLSTQSRVLKQSAIGSVFAQAYEISNVAKDWPLAPGNFVEVYEKLIFPPLRSPSHIGSLRAAWMKRINLARVDSEAWENNNHNANPKKGKVDRDKLREQREQERDKEQLDAEKFSLETLPDLIWQMETDLFKNGDESGSSARMLAHIQKYIAHKSARKWTEDLLRLLNPELPASEENSLEPPSTPASEP